MSADLAVTALRVPIRGRRPTVRSPATARSGDARASFQADAAADVGVPGKAALAPLAAAAHRRWPAAPSPPVMRPPIPHTGDAGAGAPRAVAGRVAAARGGKVIAAVMFAVMRDGGEPKPSPAAAAVMSPLADDATPASPASPASPACVARRRDRSRHRPTPRSPRRSRGAA
ncbi:MAG: hypothetical protein KIT31_32540 [Deltaproteobacteria bacterium]|nr:hypothetical protein [Deltaproteobacteria bacterium]